MKKAVRFGILVALAAYGLTVYLSGAVRAASAPWPAPFSLPSAVTTATGQGRSPSSADRGSTDTGAGFSAADLVCVCNCVTEECIGPAVSPRDLLSPCEQAVVNNLASSDSLSGHCIEQCLQDCGPSQCAGGAPSCGGTCCPAGDACVAGTCVPAPVAASCVPTSSLSILIQGTNVTSYVPKGAWDSSTTGVSFVQVEGAAPTNQWLSRNMIW